MSAESKIVSVGIAGTLLLAQACGTATVRTSQSSGDPSGSGSATAVSSAGGSSQQSVAGTGGAMPAASGSGSGGELGGGGGGAGGACSGPDDCAAATTCVSYTCEAATCVPKPAAKGTPCSDGQGTICNGSGNCVAWAKLSNTGAPAPRFHHSAVWTGSHMVVFGGTASGGQVFGDGAKYDPQTDTWTAISTTNAPEARHSHKALWVSDKMYVWGGYGKTGYAVQGGIYDPLTDSWSKMSINGQPSGRTKFSMVWDSSHQKLIVFGGINGINVQASGGVYDLVTDSWTATPSQGAPTKRLAHMAVWVLPKVGMPNGYMAVFGGTDTFDWFRDGALFDPVNNTWLAINNQPGTQGGAPPPQALESSSAVRYGDSMFLWGGWDGGTYYAGGHFLRPSVKPGGYWYTINNQGAPAGRAGHVSLYPDFYGIFVWGGCGGQACSTVYADGGVWTQGPGGGKWENFPADPALSARRDTAAVWTGQEAIVWGGITGTTPLGDGARRRVQAATF